MIGSAIRKPRIHPGLGSDSADSMIDGRTMLSGTGLAPSGPCCDTSARSPNALVNA